MTSADLVVRNEEATGSIPVSSTNAQHLRDSIAQ
jgi:hypothetical protein